jgi:ribosomal protein S18 acetylase RimI-like enzyme
MKNLRLATASDLSRISAIENACFPESEAASLSSFIKRFSVFPECFFVLEVNGEIIGHVNGCLYHRPELPDELYHNASLHCPNGQYQTVFGLAVAPDYQRKGYASLLIQHLIKVSKARGQLGVVLTCKDYLIGFYQRNGFEHLGESESSHGGECWNDMLLRF